MAEEGEASCPPPVPRPSNALANSRTLRGSAPPPRRRRPAAPPGPVIIRQRAGTAASARVANQSRALPGGRVTGRAAKQKSLINSGRRAGGCGGPERVGVRRPHLSSLSGGERRRRQRVGRRGPPPGEERGQRRPQPPGGLGAGSGGRRSRWPRGGERRARSRRGAVPGSPGARWGRGGRAWGRFGAAEASRAVTPPPPPPHVPFVGLRLRKTPRESPRFQSLCSSESVFKFLAVRGVNKLRGCVASEVNLTPSKLCDLPASSGVVTRVRELGPWGHLQAVHARPSAPGGSGKERKKKKNHEIKRHFETRFEIYLFSP